MIILNVILITMVCRIGVSLVDPFSHVVLILQLHQQAFPPYPFWVHVLLFPGSTVMILGYQASYSETSTNFLNFFFPIRATDPISKNTFNAKRKKKGVALGRIRSYFYLCEYNHHRYFHQRYRRHCHHHRHHRYLHRRLTVLCRLRLLRLNCHH